MLLSSTTVNGAVSNDSNNNITMSVGNTVIANVNSSGIYFESGKKAIYTGAVLQVVQTTTTSQISTTSSSYQASGVIASLTPISSTSKILISVAGGGGYNSASNVGGDNKIYRQIASGGYSALGANEVDWCGPQSGQATIVVPHSFAYLDSPATTSTVYYQPYYRVNPVGGGGTYQFNVNYYSNMIGKLSITLMEIAV